MSEQMEATFDSPDAAIEEMKRRVELRRTARRQVASDSAYVEFDVHGVRAKDPVLSLDRLQAYRRSEVAD